MDIDKFLCIKVYTKVKSFCPALIRPPLRGPSLISAPAELVCVTGKLDLHDHYEVTNFACTKGFIFAWTRVHQKILYLSDISFLSVPQVMNIVLIFAFECYIATSAYKYLSRFTTFTLTCGHQGIQFHSCLFFCVN